MVDRPSGPQRSQGPTWPHDQWRDYEEYRTIHDRYIRLLIDEGIVLRNRLAFNEIRTARRLVEVQVAGVIACTNDVLIDVDKWLVVRKQPGRPYEVKGYSYSYHAWLRHSRRHLIRYDTSHGLAALHRHDFDAVGTERVQPIKLDELPNLDGFIRDAVALASFRAYS